MCVYDTRTKQQSKREENKQERELQLGGGRQTTTMVLTVTRAAGERGRGGRRRCCIHGRQRTRRQTMVLSPTRRVARVRHALHHPLPRRRKQSRGERSALPAAAGAPVVASACASLPLLLLPFGSVFDGGTLILIAFAAFAALAASAALGSICIICSVCHLHGGVGRTHMRRPPSRTCERPRCICFRF